MEDMWWCDGGSRAGSGGVAGRLKALGLGDFDNRTTWPGVDAAELPDVDMERVVDELGRDRFSLDPESSRARASLVALVERRGVAFGRISFDVVVVPATIKDAEFREARLQATGSVELPLEAGRPGRVLEIDLHTRYDGWIKRKGIKATIDFDHTTVGREERR